MKKSCLLIILVLLLGDNVLGYSSGPPDGHAHNPPDFNNCRACHNTYPLNENGADFFYTQPLPESYTPNETYQIELYLGREGQMRWGFELAVQQNDGSQGGILTVGDDGYTQISTTENITYLKHTSAGSFSDDPNGGWWSFSWTAPDAGTGDVTFYAAGNQANNDGTTSGDYINVLARTVQESGNVGEPDIFILWANQNFGMVQIGYDSTRFFRILNQGTLDLQISNIISSNPVFTIPEINFPYELADGQEIDIAVTFTPVEALEYNETLEISSTDPDEPVLYAYLTGEGWYPAPPFPFDLFSPEDESIVSGNVAFGWTETSDPDPGDYVDNYQVQLSQDNQFSTYVHFDTGFENSILIDLQSFDKNAPWYWRVLAEDSNTEGTFSTQTWSINVQDLSVTENAHPHTFELVSIYPNPFNNEVNIKFDLSKTTDLELIIYDIMGRYVKTLNSGVISTGTNTFTWKPTGSGGIYFLCVNTLEASIIYKLVYLK